MMPIKHSTVLNLQSSQTEFLRRCQIRHEANPLFVEAPAWLVVIDPNQTSRHVLLCRGRRLPFDMPQQMDREQASLSMGASSKVARPSAALKLCPRRDGSGVTCISDMAHRRWRIQFRSPDGNTQNEGSARKSDCIGTWACGD